MNIFDTTIINFLNKFSQHSWIFDNTCAFLSDNNLVKGGIFTIVIWWLWFKNTEHQVDIREKLISILISCFAAMLLARTLAFLLPYRERPLHEAALNLVLPYGSDPSVLIHWSSFPSDHAALFFAMAIGFYFISKKLGIVALIYTTIVVAFPRIYLGVHYPTDIIGGALIGLAIGWVVNQNFVREKISRPILSWSKKTPSLFYSLFFLITYQIAELFDSTREVAHFGIQILKHIF